MLGADVRQQEVRRFTDQLPPERRVDPGGRQDPENRREHVRVGAIEQRQEGFPRRIPPDRAVSLQSGQSQSGQSPESGVGRPLNPRVGIDHGRDQVVPRGIVLAEVDQSTHRGGSRRPGSVMGEYLMGKETILPAIHRVDQFPDTIESGRVEAEGLGELP